MGGWQRSAAIPMLLSAFWSCRDFLWTSIKTALRGGAHTSDSRRAFRARARALPRPTGRSRRTSPSPRVVATSRAPCDPPRERRASPVRRTPDPPRAMSGMAARLARALGFTPTQDQVASALLGVPRAGARRALPRSRGRARRHRDPPRRRDARRVRAVRREAARGGATSFARPPARPRQKTKPDASRASLVAAAAGGGARLLRPGGGAGLFATSRVPRGALVALYGGVYVPPVPPVTPGADGVAVVIPAPAAADDDAALAYLIHLAAGGCLDGAAHAAAARAAADAGKCAGWGVAALATPPARGRAQRRRGGRRVGGDAGARRIADGGTSPRRSLAGVSTAPDASRRFSAARRDDETASLGSSDENENVEWLARRVLNPVKRNGPWYIDGATGAAVAVAPTVPARGVALVASKTLEPGTEVFFDYQLSASRCRSGTRPSRRRSCGASWTAVEECDSRRTTTTTADGERAESRAVSRSESPSPRRRARGDSTRDDSRLRELRAYRRYAR